MTETQNSYMLLWLEGPLQAWGSPDSKAFERKTLEFPTRSGIMGLIFSAMGASGEQCELLSKFAEHEQTVISYVRTENQKAVRQKPPLKDFHMTGAAYNKKDPQEKDPQEKEPWETLFMARNSQGKKGKTNTILTYRYYLQDAAFAVIMTIPQDMKQTLQEAFMEPCYDLSLGRKNCIPTEFIYRGIYDTEEQAQEEAQKFAIKKQKIENFRIIEGKHSEGEHIVLNDMPIRFGMSKIYRERIVTKLLNKTS